MSKPILALDIDGVCWKQGKWMISELNKRFRTNFTVEDIDDFEYRNFSERQKQYLFKLWEETDYLFHQPVKGFHDVLKELNTICRVLAVSSPMTRGPLHIYSKWQRLQKEFGKHNVYLCKDKTLVNADILVDDAPHNITEWLEVTEKPVVIQNTNYNKDLREDLLANDPRSGVTITYMEKLTELPTIIKMLIDDGIL